MIIIKIIAIAIISILLIGFIKYMFTEKDEKELLKDIIAFIMLTIVLTALII